MEYRTFSFIFFKLWLFVLFFLTLGAKHSSPKLFQLVNPQLFMLTCLSQGNPSKRLLSTFPLPHTILVCSFPGTMSLRPVKTTSSVPLHLSFASSYTHTYTSLSSHKEHKTLIILNLGDIAQLGAMITLTVI